MWDTYILINQLNGCLEGVNSTCLHSQAHLYLLAFHTFTALCWSFINVIRCACKTHSYPCTNILAKKHRCWVQDYQPPTTFIHHDSTKPNDSNILHSLWRCCTVPAPTKLMVLQNDINHQCFHMWFFKWYRAFIMQSPSVERLIIILHGWKYSWNAEAPEMHHESC